MRSRHAAIVFLFWILSSGSAGAQDQPRKTVEPFAFRPGQTVYVTAYHTIEHSQSRRSNAAAVGAQVDNHLPAEGRIRSDFEKRGIFKLVNKASEADFVFVVLIDDSAAEGLAVAPGVFAQHRNPLDLGPLREAAYSRSLIGPLKIHNLGRISDQLVKRFHDEDARPGSRQPQATK